MFSLLNHQVPFLFSDTASLDRVAKFNPKMVVIPPQNPTKEILEKISMLSECGTSVVVMVNHDISRDAYRMCEEVVFIENVDELSDLLFRLSLVQADGDTYGVVSMWTDDGILVVNSENKEKTVSYQMNANTAKDYANGAILPFKCENGWTTVLSPPYGVVVIK